MSRRPVERRWRIKDEVLTKLNAVPGRTRLEGCVELLISKGMDAKGTGNDDFTNLGKGKEVSRFLALCVVEYFKANPQDLPAALRAMTADDDKLFAALFEYVSDTTRSYKYESPSERNDPVMIGLKWVGSSLAESIYTIPEFIKKIEPGRCDDIGDYMRICTTNIGFAFADNKRITSQEARRVYEETIGDAIPLQELAHRIIQINPDAIRYALLEGQPVGVSAAFAITDEAYEATIRGERHVYSYEADEIVPHSNNIVLLSYAEDLSRSTDRLSKVRVALSTGFLSQLALLIDPDRKGQLRFATCNIHPGNTKRLRSHGYTELVHKFHPTFDCSLMVLDKKHANFRTRLLLPPIRGLLKYNRRRIDKATKGQKLD